MQVQPARIEQVLQADDGAFVIIGADSSSVVKDLQAMDKRLQVRFAHRAREPFFEVVIDHGDDRPPERVKTVQAHQNRLGVWEGLDERLVRHFESIDPQNRSGYDFVEALERSRVRREAQQRAVFEERMGDAAERVAHSIRRETGERYRGRAFVPRGVRE